MIPPLYIIFPEMTWLFWKLCEEFWEVGFCVKKEKSHFLQLFDLQSYYEIFEALVHINRTSLIMFEELFWLWIHQMLSLLEPGFLEKRHFFSINWHRDNNWNSETLLLILRTLLNHIPRDDLNIDTEWNGRVLEGSCFAM